MPPNMPLLTIKSVLEQQLRNIKPGYQPILDPYPGGTPHFVTILGRAYVLLICTKIFRKIRFEWNWYR